MKTIVCSILSVVFATTLCANPIYMQYEGIDGDVSVKAEVRNGKAVFKNRKLKAGTYRVSLIFTGKDAKTADNKPRSKVHVKVFDGRTEFSGGVRVAVGDVTGDGRADLGATGGGGGAGKVQMQDFHFSMRSTDGKMSQASIGSGKVTMQDIHLTLQPSGSDAIGQLGTFQITAPERAGVDSFFDIFTEISLD